MTFVPYFKCPYCLKENKAQMDGGDGNLIGTLSLCDCAEFKQFWESKHRAQIEMRKKFNAAVKTKGNTARPLKRTNYKG